MATPKLVTSTPKNEHLKVCVKGKEDKIFYCFIPISYNDLKSTLQDMIPKEDITKMRMYWIDRDGDQIIIDSYMAYNIFVQMSEKKKVFVEIEGKASKVSFAPTTEENSSPNEKIEHKDVECDVCGECPIIGFRYKCVQCPNFDLCMKCEAKMLHKQHAMFRFPVSINRFHLHRSFFKKVKKNCSMRTEPESEDDSHNHSGRHHRRSHCSGKQNFISNLYSMMHDLAEGTDVPTNEQTMTSENETTSSAQNQQSETRNNNNNNDNNNSNNNGHTENQPGETNIKIDPNYAKVGIQILNNFSEMFSKMLDPLGINVEVDIDLKDNKEEKKSDKKNKENETSNDDNAKQSERKNSNHNGTSEKANEGSERSSLNQEIMKTATNDQEEKKKDSVNDESNDWTLVDKTIEKENTSNDDKNTDEGAVGGIDKKVNDVTASEKSQSEPASNVDYMKLSQDLWKHLKKEEEEEKPEMRAQIVYHPKPHINNAVIAMTAMGFSNEGNWLTHLLESVDGDISQALDLLKPVK